MSGKMTGLWLPMEFRLKIVENVFNPSDLFSLRLVDHTRYEAASKQLKHKTYLSLDPKPQEEFKKRLHDKPTRIPTHAMVI